MPNAVRAGAGVQHCGLAATRRTETSQQVLVFTFPGQGSQKSGMGEPWVDHPSWEFVGEASEAAGRDLAYLLLEAPIDELTRTENAQLATTVLSLVVLDAVERLGLSPAACAGHSLGEYTALVASGALTFEDGIQLVVARGDAMARAGDEAPGTMAAILGISDDDAEAACQRAEGDVWVANYNAPGQVVIAGTVEAVAVAGRLAKELGAKRVMPIPVSGAFHTPLMQGARATLRKALADVTFRAPEVRVVANVDARVHDDPADWPGLLSAQLCSPVRWRQTLETFAGLGLTSLIELGPGGVLSGLAKRSLPEIQSLAVAKPADLDTLMDRIAEAGTWKAEPALAPGRAPLHVRTGGGEPGQRDLHAGRIAAGARHGTAPGHRRRTRRRRHLGRRRGRSHGAGRHHRGAHPLRGPGDRMAGRGR